MKKMTIIVFMLLMLCSCNKKEEVLDYRYTDYYEYMIDNKDNIKMVKMSTATEAGHLCYDVTDYKDDLYDKIINIEIVNETSERIVDDDMSYTFIFNDNTALVYSFEGQNYYYNKSYYKINGFYKIPLNMIEDKQIDCM